MACSYSCFRTKQLGSSTLANVTIKINNYHLLHHFCILSLICTTVRGRSYYPHFTDGENGNFRNWPWKSREIRIQTQTCLNQGLRCQIHTTDIPRKQISWLLIFEDIDHFNPMEVTLFPTTTSHDIFLKTHYFPLLCMAIVSYTVNQISRCCMSRLFVLSLMTKTDRTESYFLLHFQANAAARVPSIKLCSAPSVLQASVGVPLFLHSY